MRSQLTARLASFAADVAPSRRRHRSRHLALQLWLPEHLRPVATPSGRRLPTNKLCYSSPFSPCLDFLVSYANPSFSPVVDVQKWGSSPSCPEFERWPEGDFRRGKDSRRPA